MGFARVGLQCEGRFFLAVQMETWWSQTHFQYSSPSVSSLLVPLLGAVLSTAVGF